MANRVEVSLNYRHGNPAPHGHERHSGVLIGLGRQRHQGQDIEGVEELAAAGTELAHQRALEFRRPGSVATFNFGEREEAPVRSRAKSSLDDKNRRLHLGPIARLARGRAAIMVVP